MPNRATQPILVNGKFLDLGPTAVYRVARELVSALWRVSEGRSLVLAAPERLGPIVNDPGSAHTVTGRGRGMRWEQVSLPLAARGGVLVNLCNMTPLVARDALTMVHDAQVFHEARSYHPLRRTWLQLNARAAGRMQPGLLTVSDFARGQLAGLGIAPLERIHTIHNGVDHIARETPDPGVLARLGLTPGRYAVGLSTLMPHKNIGVLIRAFARPEMADKTLVLVGKPSAVDFAEAGVTPGPNVLFPGYVDDGALRSLFEQALAVCTPSRTEGFGMPPVEAMFLGTPAVIAPCGALPEVCGPHALRADPDAPEAWAAALCKLAESPDTRARIGAASRDFAARYTWDAAARRVLALIDRIFG